MDPVKKSERIKKALREGFQDGTSKMAQRKCYGYAYQTRRGIKWMSFSEEDVMGAKRGAGVYNPTAAQVK